MVRRHVAIAMLAVATALRASASEPPQHSFSPQPPGTVVQSVLFYPEGEGTESQWRAVASRVHLGGSAYQWYLSIYAIDARTATYHLKYQSPRDGVPAVRVEKRASALWLPLETVHIVGEAQLEQSSVENLVLEAHQASADCGSGTMTIFGYDWSKRRIGPIATVSNPCELLAAIVRGGQVDAVRIAGPYYAAGAPLCCPTKPRVSADLRFVRGKWVEQPNLFSLTIQK
jgi:hypothetical protein